MIDSRALNPRPTPAFHTRPVRRARRAAPTLNRVFRRAPRLADYVQGAALIAVKGELGRPISGLAIDSRHVVPGNVFFALPGLRADGATFIDEAVSRGAVAVVAEKMPPFPPAKVTFLQVADARTTLAHVAQRYHRFPDRDLTAIGVTGTTGKTTVAHLIKHFLNGQERVGLLGTIHYDLGARTMPSYRTTPESLDLYGLMAQMRDAGCRHAVIEVSSHGLEQKRVLGLQFGVAVFTNLTRDHLDDHGTLEKYSTAKTRLFTGGTGAVPKIAVVNLDDAHGAKLVAKLTAELPDVELVTFGENPRAQVRAESVALHLSHSTFCVVWPGGTHPIDTPLIGRFNVNNLLGAIATMWALGRDPRAFLEKLRTFAGVPGRMEPVNQGQSFSIFVDYAHTDSALRNALGMLRAVTPGRLRVVFGCVGHRDRERRPLMVRAAQECADHAFATADNPRTEPIGQIFDDMRLGVSAPEKISWIEHRHEAIRTAIESCQPGDCLLIAGKGHEAFQEFADTVFPFDDRLVARELLAANALVEP